MKKQFFLFLCIIATSLSGMKQEKPSENRNIPTIENSIAKQLWPDDIRSKKFEKFSRYLPLFDKQEYPCNFSTHLAYITGPLGIQKELLENEYGPAIRNQGILLYKHGHNEQARIFLENKVIHNDPLRQFYLATLLESYGTQQEIYIPLFYAAAQPRNIKTCSYDKPTDLEPTYRLKTFIFQPAVDRIKKGFIQSSLQLPNNLPIFIPSYLLPPPIPKKPKIGKTIQTQKTIEKNILSITPPPLPKKNLDKQLFLIKSLAKKGKIESIHFLTEHALKNKDYVSACTQIEELIQKEGVQLAEKTSQLLEKIPPQELTPTLCNILYTIDLKKDPSSTQPYILSRFAHNNAQAAYRYAKVLESHNNKHSFKFYKKAAQLGIYKAHYDLALHYFKHKNNQEGIKSLHFIIKNKSNYDQETISMATEMIKQELNENTIDKNPYIVDAYEQLIKNNKDANEKIKLLYTLADKHYRQSSFLKIHALIKKFDSLIRTEIQNNNYLATYTYTKFLLKSLKQIPSQENTQQENVTLVQKDIDDLLIAYNSFNNYEKIDIEEKQNIMGEICEALALKYFKLNNKTQAQHFYAEGTRYNNSTCLLYFGELLLYRSKFSEKNIEKGLELLEKSYKKNNKDAAQLLSLFFSFGPSPFHAFKYFMIPNQNKIYDYIHNTKIAKEQNFRQPLENCQKPKDELDYDGHYHYGLYLFDKGSYQEAHDYLKIAADQNNIQAKFYLALCLTHSFATGKKQDFSSLYMLFDEVLKHYQKTSGAEQTQYKLLSLKSLLYLTKSFPEALSIATEHIISCNGLLYEPSWQYALKKLHNKLYKNLESNNFLDIKNMQSFNDYLEKTINIAKRTNNKSLINQTEEFLATYIKNILSAIDNTQVPLNNKLFILHTAIHGYLQTPNNVQQKQIIKNKFETLIDQIENQNISSYEKLNILRLKLKIYGENGIILEDLANHIVQHDLNLNDACNYYLLAFEKYDNQKALDKFITMQEKINQTTPFSHGEIEYVLGKSQKLSKKTRSELLARSLRKNYLPALINITNSCLTNHDLHNALKYLMKIILQCDDKKNFLGKNETEVPIILGNVYVALKESIRNNGSENGAKKCLTILENFLKTQGIQYTCTLENNEYDFTLV